MLGELTKGVHGKQFPRFQFLIRALIFIIRHFAGNDLALAARKIEKAEWMAIASPLPTEPSPLHEWSLRIISDFEMISDERAGRLLAILNLENERPVRIPGPQFFEAVAFVPCLSQPHAEALSE